MLLHGYYRSSAVFRVRIALNLKGLAYETVSHHLRKGEQRAPDYLALNPQGLVPALETDDGLITQSLAMMEYLEETHPQPPLLPSSPGDRARVRALALICVADIHPIDNLRVLKYLRAAFGQDEDAIAAWYCHWIREGFGPLEAELAGDPRTGRFCHGDEPGLADVCLVPQVVNGQNYKLDMSPYPTINRIFDAAMALPAFERALPKHAPDAEA
jgi:maleylacetoacetate isomerase